MLSADNRNIPAMPVLQEEGIEYQDVSDDVKAAADHICPGSIPTLPTLLPVAGNMPYNRAIFTAKRPRGSRRRSWAN